MSGVSEGVEHYPDVVSVDAVPKDARTKADVTFTEGVQYSLSVLVEDLIRTVDLAASNDNYEDAKSRSVLILKSGPDSHRDVKI